MKIKILRLISAVALIMWMTLIFAFSSESAAESTGTSDSFTKTVVSYVYPEFVEMEYEQQQEIINVVSFPVRKLAHFSLFAVLGVFSILFFATFLRLKIKYRYLLSLIFCFLYAISDELHQLFVTGRACRLYDIAIDVIGSLAGISICALILFKNTKLKAFFTLNTEVKRVRKKILMQQNLSLFEQLQHSQFELLKVKRALADKEDEIRALKVKIRQLEAQETNTSEPIKNLQEKIICNAAVKPDVEYASRIIGEIVVESATYSDKLASGGNENNRELMNLILGKTEVCKSEILSVVSSDISLEAKMQRVDDIAAAAKDYFESVMAQ